MERVTIVGAGLAGSEAALQLAHRGIPVRLIEMRPAVTTGAHRTGHAAEIVCSNSFKSTLTDTAAGTLKAELDVLGTYLLRFAREARVAAAHALAVDRELFSTSVTRSLEDHPNIEIVRRCQEDLDLPVPLIIATGPLTVDAFSEALQRYVSGRHLYFYDAMAPSIDGDTIDTSTAYWASRYGKGAPDYLNIPLGEDDYSTLIDSILAAETAEAHPFEDEKYFEACLPIEVMARRGRDTLRFGPLKPKGLPNPKTGREPHAVVQLRRESRSGNLMGLVGFQTRMKWSHQKALVRSIPGLQAANILRYGAIHRNMYLNIPRVCKPYQTDRTREGLYYAGQICGVEGYTECIMSGLVSALAIAVRMRGKPFPPLAETTMIGALMNHVHAPADDFQPMNANMGLLPVITGPKRRRRERNQALHERAVAAAQFYRATNGWLFEPMEGS